MLGYPVTTRPCIAEYLLQRMQEMGKKKGPAVIEALGKGTTRKLISIDNLVTASEKQGLGYASTLVNHVLDQVSFTLHRTCTKAVHGTRVGSCTETWSLAIDERTQYRLLRPVWIQEGWTV